MASSTKPKLLRRALALGASACLLVVVASAGAETAPGAEAHEEATAVTDATTVATGRFVALAEGIGVGDGTGSLAGQVVGVAEGVGISDDTDTITGQAVQIGEGIAVGDGTEAEGMNAPPTVLVAALTGDEGSAATGAGSFADPDSATWTATVDYGDGTPTQPLATQPDKTFELSHVYDDDGAYLVTVTVTDGQGESGSATAAVTIANVAPEATLADAAGDEGSPVTIALTDPHDPSAADTAAGFTYRFACDGASLAAETASPTTQCTFDDDGTYTVLARIADKDGGHTDYTADVVVANVAPTAELANDGPVAEGSPATLSWSGAADASADTAAGFTYRYACDGATLGPETSDATASCTFDDGPASHTVLARIADDDGGFTDYTTVVAVENAPPDGTLANDGPVAEGGSATISWAGQSDPSAADTAAGFTYSYACDGVTLGAPTSDPTATCTFDDGPASHTVLARITDKDGGSTDRTTVVEVTSLPPTATLGNDGPVAEGTPVAVAFAGQSDPSQADAAAGFTYSYACDGVTLGPPTADPATTCAFDDGPATHTVLARITDKDGSHADYTTDVVVTNVAPTATLVTPEQPTDEGSTFTLALADASDPSAADTAAGFTIEFDCGTGAGFAAGATCVGLDDPSQAVRARIADKDGGETVLVGSVPVANVAPSVTITGPPAGSLYQVGQS
ncbi:MAG TPA: PKD domain-containing protein, partial [Actinomycetota bacterium]